MRLVCLNTWGGKLIDPLVSFANRYQKTTQIFCFQEVFGSASGSTKPRSVGGDSDFYDKLLNNLSGFRGYLTEPYSSFEERLAIIADSEIASDYGDDVICEQGEMRADKESEKIQKGQSFSLGSRLQWVKVNHGDRRITIANVHGIWHPSGKHDTPERVQQSKKISRFLRSRQGPRILCGDLNLLPNTRSMRILEDSGFRNLVKEYGVTSTRSKHYLSGRGSFADYILTSAEVRVRDFRVLQDEVSDHLPLLLDFD